MEKSIAKVIIQNTLMNGKYISEGYLVNIRDGSIRLNNQRCSIIIDTGGGKNTLGKTMIQSNKNINGHNIYAIQQDNSSIILVPLKYEDGPVALQDGYEIILLRVPLKTQRRI